MNKDKDHYNFRECSCCDNCKYWEWLDDNFTRIKCSKLDIELTDEQYMICDLYKENEY